MVSRNRTPRAIAAIVVLWLTVSAALYAQEPVINRVELHEIDTSGFPTIRLNVSVTDKLGARIPGLGAGNFEVTENGAPVQVSATEESAGFQVVFVIDASGSMLSPGASGSQRLEEAKQVVSSFAESYMLDVMQDWVLLLAPEGTEGDVHVISDWTHFQQEVLNQLYLYLLPEGAGETPLFNSVWEAIEQLETREHENLGQLVVVFSDGVDRVSYITQSDVTDRAQELGLSIHTVFLGPTETQAASNLKNMAETTGGQYVHYTAPEVVTPMLEAIVGQREQTVLEYGSPATQSGERVIQVGVRLDASAPIAEKAKDQTSYTVNVQPPEVTISLPSGSEIIREGATHDADPRTIEPLTWPVDFQISWPDGHPREITQVECVIDGGVQPAVPRPPSGRIACDVSLLPSGPHSFRVRATDSLGLQDESGDIPANVQVILPPPPVTVPPTPSPTPTPPPTPVPTPTPSGIAAFFANYGSLGALLIALGALILVIFVLIRRPRISERVTTAASSIATSVREATEPFFPNRDALQEQTRSKAYLVIVTGDGVRTGDIDLIGDNIRFGRDPALATVTFSDRSVSRLHARISEEQDGHFFVYDQGSTGGTFVNYEQIPVKGQLLHHDDLINLGRIQLQFKLRDAEPDESMSTQPFQLQRPDQDDMSTQPFELQQPDQDDGLSTTPFDPIDVSPQDDK